MKIRIKAISIEIGSNSSCRGRENPVNSFRGHRSACGESDKNCPRRTYYGFPPERLLIASPKISQYCETPEEENKSFQFLNESAFVSPGAGVREINTHKGSIRLLLFIIIPFFILSATYLCLARKHPQRLLPLNASPCGNIRVEGNANMPDCGRVSVDDGEAHPSVDLVIENFKAINEKNFQIVYDIRSRSIKDERDINFYRDLYSNNISIDVLDAQLGFCSDCQALVNIRLCSQDEYMGRTEKGIYTGWFILVKEESSWKICDSHIRKVKDMNLALSPAP